MFIFGVNDKLRRPQTGWMELATYPDDESRKSFPFLVALATLWVLSIGGEDEGTMPPNALDALPPSHVARKTKSQSPQKRTLNIFTRGLSEIFGLMIHNLPVFCRLFLT
jgi:hypothetical protein